VTIVTLEDGEKYHTDVSFSGDGPTRPMPLRDDAPFLNLGTQYIRLRHSTIDQFGPDVKWWIYEYRNGRDEDWNSYYCFYEIPFIHKDFKVINLYACMEGYLPKNIVIVGFTRQDGRIVGKTMLINGTVKKNTGGKTETVEECKTEEERVNALQKFFGIVLTPEQKKCIDERVTKLGEKLLSN